jgi:hypothetical protein
MLGTVADAAQPSSLQQCGLDVLRDEIFEAK